MIYKAKIINIGSSKGIIIPKIILQYMKIDEGGNINLDIRSDKLKVKE